MKYPSPKRIATGDCSCPLSFKAFMLHFSGCGSLSLFFSDIWSNYSQTGINCSTCFDLKGSSEAPCWWICINQIYFEMWSQVISSIKWLIGNCQIWKIQCICAGSPKKNNIYSFSPDTLYCFCLLPQNWVDLFSCLVNYSLFIYFLINVCTFFF